MKIRVLVFTIILSVIPVLGLCFASVLQRGLRPHDQRRGIPTWAVEGVWRLSEITSKGPDGTTNSSPQPGIYIFTARYFSHDAVSSDAPRPLLPQGRTLTDKDIADIAKPFLGSAGTYTIEGDHIIVRPIVALNPNYMRPEYSRTYTFRFDGRNTLWLSEIASGATRIDDPMLKLIRLE